MTLTKTNKRQIALILILCAVLFSVKGVISIIYGNDIEKPDEINLDTIQKLSKPYSIHKQVRERNKIVIEEIGCDKCPSCLSTEIVKHGIRHNGNYDLQRNTNNYVPSTKQRRNQYWYKKCNEKSKNQR